LLHLNVVFVAMYILTLLTYCM